jgi:hypothetical protein
LIAHVISAGQRTGPREIAPQLVGLGTDVFGRQPEVLAAGKHVLEQFTRLRAPTWRDQGIDVSERANDESVLGRAEPRSLI